MQMEQRRCESPAMVRKEVYAHMIAYNLIRDLIVHTSIIYNTSPTRLSHKGEVQALNAFAEKLNPDSNNIEALESAFMSRSWNTPSATENRVFIREK